VWRRDEEGRVEGTGDALGIGQQPCAFVPAGLVPVQAIPKDQGSSKELSTSGTADVVGVYSVLHRTLRSYGSLEPGGGAWKLRHNWLRVFRNPGASRTGHRRRQQQHTRAVWPEKCGGLRGTAWHKMQVITEFFGSGARAALPGHRAAFFSSFKELARCTKLATSYYSTAKVGSVCTPENSQPVM
jgi:hypothetical protein